MRTTALTLLLAALASGAPQTTVSAATAQKAAAKSEVLPFISDDYAHAVAEAKARGVPIFIEAWAPW